MARTALTWTIALFTLTACQAASGPFHGSFNGELLSMTSAWSVMNGATLTITFSTTQEDCRTPVPPVGTTEFTFGVTGDELRGEHRVQDTVVGSTVFATVTTFPALPDGGPAPPSSQVLSAGTIRIDALTDGGVSGWGQATAVNADFSGDFSAEWCAL